MGKVIQLQGDQRNDVYGFLVDKKEGLEMEPETIEVSDSVFAEPAQSLKRCFFGGAGPWVLDVSTSHPSVQAEYRGLTASIAERRACFRSIVRNLSSSSSL